MIAMIEIPRVVFLGFMGTPGPMEMIIIGAIAVLLFGSRLPSVARSLGKSFVEFKRGMSGFETDINEAIYKDPSESNDQALSDDRLEPSAPKFEPPPADSEQKPNEQATEAQ